MGLNEPAKGVLDYHNQLDLPQQKQEIGCMQLDTVYKTNLPNGRIRISATALYDSVGNGPNQDTYYLEYPGDVERDLVESGDPWLLLFLPVSVVLAETLRINRPVDPVLLEGCLELTEIWHCWMPHLPIIKVEADVSNMRSATGDKTASFFSSGVDSLHTLLRHEDNPEAQRAEKIDELVTIFGVFGRERQLVDENRGDPMRQRMEATALRYNKRVIEVHTNVWQTKFQFTNSLDHSHGCLLGAAALAIGDRYARVVVPGSQVYSDLAPEASMPLTDRLMSTSTTRFVTDACDSTRYQKIAYLAEKEHNLASLQVCSRDHDLMNCSECFKCVCAALILEVLDKLGECELFRVPHLDLTKVMRIYCSTGYLLSDLSMVKYEAKRRNREDIVTAIDTIFARSAWIDGCRRLIAELRRNRGVRADDKRTLAQLIGLEKANSCSEDTAHELSQTLQRLPELRGKLLGLLGGENPNVLFESDTSDAQLRALEHAVVRGSICESSLYMQLFDPNRELGPPRVVYVSGKPLVVAKKQYDESLFELSHLPLSGPPAEADVPTSSDSNSESCDVMHVTLDGNTTPHHRQVQQMNQIEKYESDYFDYLNAPENAPRYRLALDQIRQHLPNRPLRLVDLGCGNGALAQYIGNDFIYFGIDHNPVSIQRAQERNWTSVVQPIFAVKNIMEWVSETGNSDEPKADVLVFSGLLGGVLFSVEHQQILSPHDEQQFVIHCMKHRLVEGGLISVVTPFSYDNSQPASLFSFAAKRRLALDQRLPLANLVPLVEAVIPMPQVNQAIARQEHKPQWMQEAHHQSSHGQKAMGVWCSLFATRI